MNREREWKIIHDCDDEETGEPTSWASEINHEKYGRFIWISRYDDEYAVEVIPESSVLVLASPKTFASAKRWVAIHFN